MRVSPSSALRGASAAIACLLVAFAACVAEGAAQTLYGGPEGGWSDLRRYTLGARLGAEVVGDFDIVGQALLHFPEEGLLADPGVAVARRAWQSSLALLWTFDRARRLAPYIGAGFMYRESHVSVTVDQRRARIARIGFEPVLLGGLRLTRGGTHPFLEIRSAEDSWMVTFGATFPIRGREALGSP